jgi:hypothetical protein
MDDAQIQSQIEALEAEEQRLRHEEEGAPTDVVARDRERLAAIKVELDQQWDLLRQRRALRDAGRDPDAAALRDPGTVEGYLN